MSVCDKCLKEMGFPKEKWECDRCGGPRCNINSQVDAIIEALSKHKMRNDYRKNFIKILEELKQ